MEVDIPKSFGALLLGGLYATLLSGFVFVQTVVYFKLYSKDIQQIKTLVLAIWCLDTFHTIFIWATLWYYLINHYGIAVTIDDIHWTLSMTILITAILTFFVHLFFVHRIFMLSKRNYLIGASIMTLAFLPLLSASATTGQMLSLKTFSSFKQEIRWIFTTTLALSSIVDVLITACLFTLLQSSRTGGVNLDAIIGSLIRYSFEMGALTCAGTIVSMICWLAMPNNLIFMGLHFVIGKLYANSLLVTLNMRANIRSRGSWESGELFARVNRLENNVRRRTDESGGLEVGVPRILSSPVSADKSTADGQTKPPPPAKLNVDRSAQRSKWLSG